MKKLRTISEFNLSTVREFCFLRTELLEAKNKYYIK
jgi:hypothetical protein